MENEATKYQMVTKTVPTFYFIGVTTTKSSIMKVFPIWMKLLRYEDVVIEGWDCQIHDTDEAYRKAVAQIKYDPLSLGALVTTHKIDLLNAARDMFDYLDPYAQITGEVSSISKLNGRLEGHAKDPITSGLSLDAIIGKDYFARTGGDVLCFGAGGSAIATLLHLINKQDKGDRPKRFTFVNRSQGRLDHAKEMVGSLKTDIEIEYIQNSDPAVNDEIMEKFPPYSIIINATGMGKDTPGSPITWEGKFPMNSIAWEFNYRGELDFMHQALAQVKSRKVVVEDGWLYFVHGWSQVVSQVLHFDLTPEIFLKLNKAAGIAVNKPNNKVEGLSKKDLATLFHDIGYGCAQCVLTPFAEDFGMTEEMALRVSTSFGSGMGRLGEVCGGLTGAFMVIGLKYGKVVTDGSKYGTDTETSYKLTEELAKKFKEKTGSIFCRDIVGYNLLDPVQREYVMQHGLFQSICGKTIPLAVELLEEIL